VGWGMGDLARRLLGRIGIPWLVSSPPVATGALSLDSGVAAGGSGVLSCFWGSKVPPPP
jgi:hypothetical protein